MYVTRRLSEYQKDPSKLTQAPPEGPSSGVLVIQDEESQPKCCFGLCFGQALKGLPFPQNVKLTVRFTTGSGQHTHVSRDRAVFIPVLNQPLSSNLYYVIRRRGKHSGEACVSVREEDKVPCCFCFSFTPDAKPLPLDVSNLYQQFEIHERRSSSGYYYATSTASDGVPPLFLRRKNWTVQYSTSESFGLSDDAKGITDSKLRNELPADLKTSNEIGKWYVPFVFVKDGDTEEQMKRSVYYSMTLEQRWEEIGVDVEMEAEVVKVGGKEIARETRDEGRDGNIRVVWFIGQERKIGLSSIVVERMKWEEERFGWKGTRVKSGHGGHVLVERFVLKRMDGSLVLTYEFRHGDKLRNM